MPGVPDKPDNDQPGIVLGVDTHKDFHVAAVISAPGALLGGETFPTTASGYHRMLSWVASFGEVRRVG